MKKFFLLTALFFLFLTFVFAPKFTNAQIPSRLVPCGNPGEDACAINDFFVLLNNVYSYIVWVVATPLAILMITIGGVMILVSAGNPNLASLGKNILRWSIIGLVLVLCAWVIINFILTAMGYINIGTWNRL